MSVEDVYALSLSLSVCVCVCVCVSRGMHFTDGGEWKSIVSERAFSHACVCVPVCVCARVCAHAIPCDAY